MAKSGTPIFKRILLKISGETFLGKKGIIDPDMVTGISREIKEIKDIGLEIGIVVGGGNIFRGKEAEGFKMHKAHADYIGMLATLINSLVLQEYLESLGVWTRVMSSIEMRQLSELYIRRRAIRHLEKGRIIIFAGGTGNPFFSTDTASALRAIEINAEVILKGTKVDGVYDKDPAQFKEAVFLDKISYLEVINKNLLIMDTTAISLCMNHKVPIIVFDLFKEGNLKKIVCGEKIGTLISD